MTERDKYIRFISWLRENGFLDSCVLNNYIVVDQYLKEGEKEAGKGCYFCMDETTCECKD